MPPRKKDPEITALEAVHAALKPLDAEARGKVLASVSALLEMPGTSLPPAARPAAAAIRPLSSRPVSLVELMKDKSPKTSPGRITLFAYYRDKYEGTMRFGRNDLREYFGKAKEGLPGNYDRDFVTAVKRGWIHEEGDESYITSKGIEAAETGFPDERQPSKRTKAASRRKRRK